MPPALRWLTAATCLLAALGCGTSTDTLARQAKSADPAERLRAVHTLCERAGEPAVVPALIEALKDEDTFVRRDAARALGRCGPQALDAVPALKGRLADHQPSVRKAAAAALKQIEGK